MALSLALLAPFGCREVEGTCSGAADHLCLEITMSPARAIDRLSIAAQSYNEVAAGKRLMQDLPAAASAFEARMRYVAEVDLTPVLTTSNGISVSSLRRVEIKVEAFRSGGLVASGESIYRVGGALRQAVVLTPPGGGDGGGGNEDLGGMGDGLTPRWRSGMAATQVLQADGAAFFPSGLCWTGSALVVSDRVNHRALVFPGLATGTAPTRTFGNATVGMPAPSPGPTTLNAPRGVWCNDTFLLIADTGNHRVLYYDRPMLSNSARSAAGQPGTGSGVRNINRATSMEGPPARNNLSSPHAVFWDTVRLYIADGGNHRVVGYPAPTSTQLEGLSTGTAAVLLGQKLFADGMVGQGATGMNGPTAVFVDRDRNRLGVVDSNNNRVMVYPIPGAFTEGTAEVATGVIGQPTLTQVGNPAGTTAERLNVPATVAGLDAETVVADRLNNRVLVFDSALPGGTPGPAAIAALGQQDLMSKVAGPGMNQMNAPEAALLIKQGVRAVIVVADTGNHRVLVFPQNE